MGPVLAESFDAVFRSRYKFFDHIVMRVQLIHDQIGGLLNWAAVLHWRFPVRRPV